MQFVQDLLRKDPKVSQINLEYLHLKDLTLCIHDLSKFPNLRRLSLYNNKLTTLPIMKSLSNLEYLNVSKNPIKVDDHLLNSLYSLEKLQSLLIDTNEEGRKRIIENFPNLRTLNQKPIIREKASDFEGRWEKIKNNLLRQKDLICQKSIEIEKKLLINIINPTEFNEIYQNIVSQFQDFIENVSKESAKEAILLYAKNKLIDSAIENFQYGLQQNGHDDCAAAVKIINKFRSQYFNSLLQIVLQSSFDEYFFNQQKKSEQKLRKQTFYVQQIMRLKKLAGSLRTQINQLEAQNKKTTALLHKIATGKKKTTRQQKNQASISQYQVLDESPFKIARGRNHSQKSLTPAKSTSKLKTNTVKPSPLKGEYKIEQNYLTIEQTQSIMYEIAKEKQAHNKKCIQKKQSFETSQEFTYTFFKLKYGLTDLAFQWSLNFIKSLEYHHKEKVQFEIFLKILKNQLEESYFQQNRIFSKKSSKIVDNFYRFTQNPSKNELINLCGQIFPHESPQSLDRMTSHLQIPAKKPYLIKEISRMHMKIHDELLQEFRRKFKRFDRDKDGILTKSETSSFINDFFQSSIERGKIDPQIPSQVYKKLDPFKKNRVLFSELVQVIDNI